jgi:hypothetical protein
MGRSIWSYTWKLGAAIAALGLSLPICAQSVPAPTSSHAASTRPAASAHPAATRPTAATRAAAATRPTAPAPATRAANPVNPASVAKTNPLLPLGVAIDNFCADLSLSPKVAPAVLPAGFGPLLSARGWQAYRERFGTEADELTRLKPSGQIAFAQRLMDAATWVPSGPELSADPPELRRYLLLRAAAIAYRTKEGYPTADKAVAAYLELMDKRSAVQVGALWSLANAISRTSVTPKPERIRYDGIAARANMQLALLMLEADQIDAAQAISKQIAYHEGWLKNDAATRAQIGRVRTEVHQAATMMDYLATQYQPAIRNDVPALTAIYLYGRYVKGNRALVADLPGRVPGSPLAEMARSLDAAARGDVAAAFSAAEGLRVAAAGTPDACIRARTLYAALQLYDEYMAAPETQRNRVQRTLARIAREGVVADGARKAGSIDPFAPVAATAPAEAPAGPARQTRLAPAPALALR